MSRNLDGLNTLRYVLGYSKFLDQAEEEEETAIEPEADDVCRHGIGFDEDCEWCELDSTDEEIRTEMGMSGDPAEVNETFMEKGHPDEHDRC